MLAAQRDRGSSGLAQTALVLSALMTSLVLVAGHKRIAAGLAVTHQLKEHSHQRGRVPALARTNPVLITGRIVAI